jgi:hypothetical protein
MVTETLVQIVFGWPAIIVSILLSIAGIWRKKPGLLMAAGIVCIPFAYYVSNGFRSPLLLLPVCELGAAYALMRGFNRIAWLLIAPLLIVAALLAYTVLTQ